MSNHRGVHRGSWRLLIVFRTIVPFSILPTHPASRTDRFPHPRFDRIASAQSQLNHREAAQFSFPPIEPQPHAAKWALMSIDPRTIDPEQRIDNLTTDSYTSPTTQHGDSAPTTRHHEPSNASNELDEQQHPIVLPPSIVTEQAKQKRRPQKASRRLKSRRDQVHRTPSDKRQDHLQSDTDASESEDDDCFIDLLPAELLVRVFAFLDPLSLARSSFVRHSWASIIRDDATWRMAFANQFQVSTQAVSLRRTSRVSWKVELIRRCDLLRRWRKSRSPAITTDMRVSSISAIAFSNAHSFLLSASKAHGVASRSDPFKGKVARGFVDAAGMLNGAGIGNPNAEFSPDVTALEVAGDASRIAWGFRDGTVALTLLTRQGSNPRGMVRSIRFSPRGSHVGPVNAVAFDLNKPGQSRKQQRRDAMGDAGEVLVTGGEDGSIRLWSPLRAVPLWVGSTQPSPEATSAAGSEGDYVSLVPPPIVQVELDADHGIVAAATRDGKLFVWSNVNVAALLAIPSQAWDEVMTPDVLLSSSLIENRQSLTKLHQAVRRADVVLPAGDSASSAPDQLFLDGESNAQAGVLLHRANDPHLFYTRVRFEGSVASHDVIKLQEPSNILSGKITCIRAECCVASEGATPQASIGPSPQLAPTSTSTTNLPVLGPLPGSLRDLSAGLFSERRFVCAGTDEGKLIGWGLPSQSTPQNVVTPSFVLDCHHTSITTVDFTPHLFAVGCSDGTIKAFDALSGSPVRTWNDRTATRHPARMLAAGELTQEEAARFFVRQIVISDENIVAAVGPHILAWRAESALSGSHSRNRRDKMAANPSSSTQNSGASPSPARSSGGGGAGGSMPPLSKYAQMREMRMELAESSTLLEAEKEKRQASYARLRYARGPEEIGGLSEHEAMEYAMMLSRDEEEARQRQQWQPHEGGARSPPLSELARIRREEAELRDALQQIAIAERNAENESVASSSQISGREDDFAEGHNDDGADDEDLSYYSSAAQESPSPFASPHLSASSPHRAWEILNTAGDSSRWNDSGTRWGSAGKVRTVMVPRSARHSSASASAPPDAASFSPRSLAAMTADVPVAESSRPRLSSSSFSSSSSLTGLELHSPEHWPSMPASMSPTDQRRKPSFGLSASNRAAGDGSDASGTGSPFLLPPSSTSTDAPDAAGASANTRGKGKDRETVQNAQQIARPASSRSSAPSPSPAPAPAVPTSSPPNSGLSSSGPKGAWAKGGPSLSATMAAQSQRTPDDAGTPGGGGGGGDREDDDLRFAIELSLAEERSRQQAE